MAQFLTEVWNEAPEYLLKKVKAAYELLGVGVYRAHGLGMLQIEVPPEYDEGFSGTHLHIWHPDLVRFPFEETGHQHRFDMESTILHGHVVSVENILVPGEEYDLVAFRGPDQQEVVRVGKTGIECKEFHISAGQSYYMAQGVYHQFRVPGLAISWVRKTATPSENKALFPAGREPRHSRDPGMLESLREDSKRVLIMAKQALYPDYIIAKKVSEALA